jgi:hypothetical protein
METALRGIPHSVSMATATPVQIPRIISGPAEKNAPSFLMTLPPELRNRIYEELFQCDGDLLLEIAKPQRLYRDELNLFYKSSRPGHRRSIPGVTLLQACRQVYHEAAGVLYSCKTVRLPAIPVAARFLTVVRSSTESQYRDAPTWLTSFGSQLSLVRKIVIEINNCYSDDHCDCDWPDLSIEILPMLKFIWANPAALPKICFAKTELTVEQAHNAMPDGRTISYHMPVRILNNLLVSIGSNDWLSIKRYANYKRLLASVFVYMENDRLESYVVFKKCEDPNTNDPETDQKFDILDEGKLVRWTHLDATESSFSRLPNHIRKEICTYACTSDCAIVFDLDSKIAFGLNMNASQLYKNSRNFSKSYAWRSSPPMSLKMSTTLSSTDLDSCTALYEWSEVATFQNMMWSDHRSGPNDLPTIILEFTGTDFKSLQDVQFDIMLLLATLPYSKAPFSIKTTNTLIDGNKRKNREETAIGWSRIQHAMFLLLSDILRDMPDKALLFRPQIWINGTFDQLQAVFPATEIYTKQTVDCHFLDLSDEEMHDLGHQKIRNLAILTRADAQTDFPAFGHLYPHFKSHYNSAYGVDVNCLAGAWSSLRKNLYKEWFLGLP